MEDERRIDWRAIPARYRSWKALPLWRKAVWLVTRSVVMVVAYVAFAAAILWYNEPEVVEGIAAGRKPLWALLGVLGARPELLVLLLVLAIAVVASVLLPHKPSWR